jgi:phosphate transport system permease protein
MTPDLGTKRFDRPAAPRAAPLRGRARRRRRADRVARAVVTIGGLLIVASVLGILVFVVAQTWPLVRGARVTPGPAVGLLGAPPAAVVGDEYRTHAATLGLDGHVRVVRIADGRTISDQCVTPSGEPLVAAGLTAAGDAMWGGLGDGRVVLVAPRFDVEWTGSTRAIVPSVDPPIVVDVDPEHRPIDRAAVAMDADGVATIAAAVGDDRLEIVRRVAEKNEMTGEVTATLDRHDAPTTVRPSRLAIDRRAENLWGGAASGSLLWWTLKSGEPDAVRVAGAGESPITALALLVGDRSLVVGQADGSLSVWFPVRLPDESFRLVRVRDFDKRGGAVTAIAPSPRDKGFLALDAAGTLGLHHSTSHRTLWLEPSPLPAATAIAFAPKADGAHLAAAGTLRELDIDNPHPETTLGTLFGKVWYENYDRPEWVWQSSGSIEVEPKLSLMPLVVGTLKGTFYSLLLAIPLGVLGAMYASQFMHPTLKRFVKPTVEIMAALPSVVLGFLAGIWLAPLVERSFTALLLAAIVLPLFVVVAGAGWRSLPRRLTQRFPVGSDALGFIVVLALGIGVCVLAGRPLEGAIFRGSFPDWVRNVLGVTYDQHNAVVVGLAMGFAVIPIIFAISEDAFSNVPRNLVSGSLALGASHWQTVTRVVLPTASAGIFSAIMIGFGRAVGETMIVLMATGNTPIMTWNPFDGFRTLSANIATEIPEAPHGGTLYRTLFLAALLLFVFTFLVNTAAEVVRQRLRRRYAEL